MGEKDASIVLEPCKDDLGMKCFVKYLNVTVRKMNRWLQSNDVIFHTNQLSHHHIYQDETIVSLLSTAATSILPCCQ